MKKILPIILLLSGFAAVSCDKKINGTENNDFNVVYETTDEDFANPERGWYHQYTVRFTNGELPSPVNESQLLANRASDRTLTLSLFYLTDFMEGDISAAALDVIGQSLEAHRSAGCKAILRFAYKDGADEEDKPYDAPVDVVLRHVEQLKPVLTEYEDVIYVLQAGFVGAWGEWYYTSHFNMSPETDEEFLPRKELVRALLDALPKSRQVELRTPEFKFKVMGISLADTITAATAFDGSDLSRLGGHNDCFVSSANDVGTYGSAAGKQLWKTETQYTIMGGETCAAKPMYCDCVPTYKALQDYHWSYLNHSYNTATHKIWKDSGCFEDISRRLGYRLVLLNGKFPNSFVPGNEISIEINLKNEGFASIINERHAELVIVSKDDADEKYTFGISADPRTWKAGQTYGMSEKIMLPNELKQGKSYLVCLNLPDLDPGLAENPMFSVRFANKNTWDKSTGYNILYEFISE